MVEKDWFLETYKQYLKLFSIEKKIEFLLRIEILLFNLEIVFNFKLVHNSSLFGIPIVVFNLIRC